MEGHGPDPRRHRARRLVVGVRGDAVKYVMDTHVVIWWLTDDRKLSKGHAKLLERSERSGTAIALSAISLWEIAKLVERGRIELTQSVDDSLEQLETSA